MVLYHLHCATCGMEYPGILADTAKELEPPDLEVIAEKFKPYFVEKFEAFIWEHDVSRCSGFLSALGVDYPSVRFSNGLRNYEA